MRITNPILGLILGTAIATAPYKAAAFDFRPNTMVGNYEIATGIGAHGGRALEFGAGLSRINNDSSMVGGSYTLQGDSGNIEHVFAVKAGKAFNGTIFELQGAKHFIQICEPEFADLESTDGRFYSTIGASVSYPVTEKENIFVQIQKPVGESKGINGQYNTSRVFLGAKSFF